MKEDYGARIRKTGRELIAAYQKWIEALNAHNEAINSDNRIKLDYVINWKKRR